MSLVNSLTEVLVRIFTAAMCIGALIAGTVTYQEWYELRNTTLATYVDDQILLKTRATAIVTVAASAVTIPEIILVTIFVFLLHLIGSPNITRILDILITVLDLLFVVFICFVFGAAAVLGGIAVSDWEDNYVKNPLFLGFEKDLLTIRKNMAATTVMSLISCGSCIVFAVFLVGKLARRCREHSEYTALN